MCTFVKNQVKNAYITHKMCTSGTVAAEQNKEAHVRRRVGREGSGEGDIRSIG